MAQQLGDAGAGESRPVTAVTLDWRSVVPAVGGLLLLLGAGAVLGSTRRAVTVIVVGTLLAFALDPLVVAVDRRLGGGRARAAIVVFGVLVTAFVALVVLVGPAAADQAQQLGEQLPETLAELEELPLIGNRLAEWEAADKIERWVDDLPQRIEPRQITDAVEGAFAGALSAVGVLLTALVLTLDGPLLIRRLRGLVPPRHRDEADVTGRVVARVVGTYFAGSLLVAMIAGTWVLIVALAMGVPLAPIAAVWYAVASLIPQVGGFLGTSFVTVLAFTQGATTGVITLGLVVGYMNFENYVLGPAIVGEAIDLSPPTTMLAAIIGGSAAGVPGALAATPLVGAVKALYMHMRHGQAIPDAQPPLRERLPGPLRRLLSS